MTILKAQNLVRIYFQTRKLKKRVRKTKVLMFMGNLQEFR